MGRIKGTIIKRSGKDLVKYNKGKFNSSFDDNKKHVKQILPEVDKKFINSITGYVTRLVKREETKK